MAVDLNIKTNSKQVQQKLKNARGGNFGTCLSSKNAREGSEKV